MKLKARTDLICEEIGEEFVKNISSNENFDVTRVDLDIDDSKMYNKKPGIYYTISTKDFLVDSLDGREKITLELTKVFETLLDDLNIKMLDKILIVGLGNIQVTPDSLGPYVIKRVLVTNHLFNLGIDEDGMGKVMSIAPGVMSQTGMETSDIIKSLVTKFNPKLVIAVDALASKNIKRVLKSIQISSAGINPGAGVGNKRKELSYDTLGCKVIAIGIPTVVDIESIRDEFINNAKIDENIISKINKIKLPEMFITVKEIDERIEGYSTIIADALNDSIHNFS